MQFEKSADTKIIESMLSAAVIGQTITYEEISKAIGRDVRVHSLSALGTARQGVLRSNGIVFGVEKNVGLVRLDDSGIVRSTENDRRTLQRKAKRSLRKLAVVEFSKLPEDLKRSHIVASAQMGTIAMFASKGAVKKLESKVNGSTAQLAIGETLKVFGGS